MPPEPWGPIQLPRTEPKGVRIGSRDLWIRLRSSELWLAHGPAPASGDDGQRPAPPEKPSAWDRWALPREHDGEIHVHPVFPDRPVVLEPTAPLHLLGRTRTRIQVPVPLFIRVAVGSDPGHRITEIPAVPLSNTWWGTHFEGEMAYWLPADFSVDPGPGARGSHWALCPVSLANRTREALEVDRLLLRVPRLTLFGDDRGLWGDETRVVYQEGSSGGEMKVTGEPPREAPEAPRLADPRGPAPAPFRGKSVGRLLSLVPMGPMP